ncbi:hypothetical protein DFP73DRAFT_598411 [Morchella snyderi]|nr:hypothetical protein DFP73DRAFT_598411 [Morchella snyderi]
MHRNIEEERTVPEVVSTRIEATKVRTGAQGAIPTSNTGFPTPRARPPGGGEVGAPVPAAGTSELLIARGGAKGDQVYIEGESYEKGDVGNKGSGAESGGGEFSVPAICHRFKGRCRDLRFLGVRSQKRS